MLLKDSSALTEGLSKRKEGKKILKLMMVINMLER